MQSIPSALGMQLQWRLVQGVLFMSSSKIRKHSECLVPSILLLMVLIAGLMAPSLEARWEAALLAFPVGVFGAIALVFFERARSLSGWRLTLCILLSPFGFLFAMFYSPAFAGGYFIGNAVGHLVVLSTTGCLQWKR